MQRNAGPNAILWLLQPIPGQPPTASQQQFGRPINMNRNKKRRFADKVVLPEIRKVRRHLTRKKLDIQEALKRPQKIKKKLRIYVSHSFIAGKEPEREGEEGAVPMWELRVEGRLLDEQSSGSAPATIAPPPANPNAKGTQSKRKFSSFFKSLVIELDKDIYGPDNHLVEWHRTPQTNETDGFQVKRRETGILAKLLGIAMETRPKIIEALWQYIKTTNYRIPQTEM
uniref:DM2 domain-containing protein n=1 Tax=Ditylenchus dipsaci TaxID=166011 RepID=A0A915ELJ6_9BILA